MTDLSRRSSRLIFRTDNLVFSRGKQRRVIVEARPGYALLRLECLRGGLPLSWESIYRFAGKIEADRQRAERRALLDRECAAGTGRLRKTVRP